LKTTSLYILILLGLTLFLLVACGGEDDDDDNDDDGDDDDASGDDVDGWPTDDRWGMVIVSEGMTSSNQVPLTYINSIYASFFDPDELEGTSQAPDETVGACSRTYFDGLAATTVETLSGGVITVTGAAVSPVELTPTNYEFGYYYFADYDPLLVDDLYSQGDLISYTTTGSGEIPGYSGSLEAPDDLAVSAPANFDTLSKLPSGDFKVSWNASDADLLTVVVTSYIGSTGHSIVCSPNDSEGTVTISEKLMEDLPVNPETISVTVTRTVFDRDSEGGKDLDFMITTYRHRAFFNNLD
jgi:hypothetical protein